ncbi:hypothetical protein EB796_009839 [Bugula neritina]|uniref:Rad21/Rec8-like protein C-terminal eukaryotic domain-containing protein n=1 Tax=Bugula neritina TaxID=10212 RepID=A0A7J7K1K0_BUGNE|nr:hypothetical protein EB796_009839 [Bugula neritina]
MREWFRSMCKPPAVTRQLPVLHCVCIAERSGHDATANIAETELPRQVASANVSRDEKLLKSMETTMNRSANISTRIETPNISNVANKTSFRTVTEESANKIIPPPEPINEQMFPPDQPDQLELMEEMQLPPEQPLEEQPVPQTENMPFNSSARSSWCTDPETPALIIDNERFQQDAEAAATPRTLSTKAKLTRKFPGKNSVVFTELDDLIQPKRTSRQEVAKLFHALLVMAKRKHVEIRQDESYGPIIITRYSE